MRRGLSELTALPNGNSPVQIPDTTVAAVVLKAEEYGSLGIVRSLGRQVVCVYWVETNSTSPAIRSRYCAGNFAWSVDTAPPEDSIAFLVKIAKQFSSRPVLIPTGDASSVLVAKHAEALQTAFRFLMSTPGVSQALYDKKQMYELCKQFDVPTAETTFPQNREDVLDFSRTAEFPVVLKPMDPWRLQQRAGVRLLIVRDKTALLESYDRLASSILQPRSRASFHLTCRRSSPRWCYRRSLHFACRNTPPQSD